MPKESKVSRRTVLIGGLSVAALSGAGTLDATAGLISGDGYEATLGQWSERITLGLVPIAAAVLPNGKVIYWSGTGTMSFHGNDSTNDHGMLTHWGIFDPASGSVKESTVNTGQEMFCPGTALRVDGRVWVCGGGGAFDRRDRVSSYDWRTGQWATEPLMQNGRWYPGVLTLHDDVLFAIGGDGDPYSPLQASRQQMGELQMPWATTGRWKLLTGFTSQEPYEGHSEAAYRAKSWWYQRVFENSAGRLLQVAPSPTMVWYDVAGEGDDPTAGVRPGGYLQGAITAYYAKDTVLLAGGAPDTGAEDPYGAVSRVPATDAAYKINLLTGDVVAIARMNTPRYMANGVVLPDGQTLAVGGNYYGELWNPAGAIIDPEIYNPVANRWTFLRRNETPRMYHSGALLLPDGRVWVGGGGGCGDCNGHPEYNHADAHIFSPPYLFKGPRPVLDGGADRMTFGTTYWIRSTGAARFTMVRMSSTTHAANSDQRLVELAFQNSTNGYVALQAPNYGTVPPGYYMLFGLGSTGVPSVAKIVQLAWW